MPVMILLLMVEIAMIAKVAPCAPGEVAHRLSPSRRGNSLPAGNVGVGPVPHATRILCAPAAVVNVSRHVV